MFHLITSETEIRSLFNQSEFVAQTCDQINKDLLGISEQTITIPSPSVNPLDDLCRQLIAVFESLNSLEKLAQFVYRVDLPEDHFRQNLDEAQWHQLTFLIVRREAQKVFLRRRFS